jgi:hypothetical protein
VNVMCDSLGMWWPSGDVVTQWGSPDSVEML